MRHGGDKLLQRVKNVMNGLTFSGSTAALELLRRVLTASSAGEIRCQGCHIQDLFRDDRDGWDKNGFTFKLLCIFLKPSIANAAPVAYERLHTRQNLTTYQAGDGEDEILNQRPDCLSTLVQWWEMPQLLTQRTNAKAYTKLGARYRLSYRLD